MTLKHYLLLIVFCFGTLTLNAQDSKEEIEKLAQTFFKKEQYIDATPLFLRLLSLEPRNPNYNYKYGTCLLFNDNKTDAFKYLNYSIQIGTEVEPEAYYFLGKAYHLNYKFNKAIENYEVYRKNSDDRTLSKLPVDRQIEMCKNGKSLFTDISETIVLDKKKINLESFFRIYDLQDIGGNLIVTEEFQSKSDKKQNHIPLIHFPANSNYIFYSSYGIKTTDTDIFYRTRKKDGSWSEEQLVNGKINTEYNEAFPFMHSSGRYLYFSSEGHKSMGGYDIFRSKYDSVSNSFLEPENMNISISSTDNDYLYIVDSLEKYAYFASQRGSELDMVHVYKVRVERLPMEMIVIKGDFKPDMNTSKEISIRVYDAFGHIVGKFKSDDKGDYIIQLPKSGNYEFIVTTDENQKEHIRKIEIPKLGKFKPILQNITTLNQGDSLVMETIFDSDLIDYDDLADVIEKKSNMEINVNEFNLDSLDQIKNDKKGLEKFGLTTYSNSDIQKLVSNKYERLNARQLKSDSLIQKSKISISKEITEYKKSLKSADSLILIINNSEKKLYNEKHAQFLEDKLEYLKKIEEELKHAQSILAILENDSKQSKAILKESKVLKEKIDKIEIANTQALTSVLNEHKFFVVNELKENTKANATSELLTEISKTELKLEDFIKKKENLITQENKLKNELKDLQINFEEATKRKQSELSFEINIVENQLSDLKSEIDYYDKQLNKFKNVSSSRGTLNKISQQTYSNTPIENQELIKEFEELKPASEAIAVASKVINQNIEQAKTINEEESAESNSIIE
uniref:hypothetical protein n=1 Tax=Brumimicrobium mesophilum TaxID=392717 RepID=UPI00131AB4F2